MNHNFLFPFRNTNLIFELDYDSPFSLNRALLEFLNKFSKLHSYKTRSAQFLLEKSHDSKKDSHLYVILQNQASLSLPW